jgi:hypothetical protein
MGNDACKPLAGTARMRVFGDISVPVASAGNLSFVAR